MPCESLGSVSLSGSRVHWFTDLWGWLLERLCVSSTGIGRLVVVEVAKFGDTGVGSVTVGVAMAVDRVVGTTMLCVKFP